jgi:hypothetical protein
VPDFLCGNSFSTEQILSELVAEESGHVRFEFFLSSQSIPLCDFLLIPGIGARIRCTGVQPVRECIAGLCQKVWPALLGLPRVLADAELLWTKVQR